jgi:hypothetical protein
LFEAAIVLPCTPLALPLLAGLVNGNPLFQYLQLFRRKQRTGVIRREGVGLLFICQGIV